MIASPPPDDRAPRGLPFAGEVVVFTGKLLSLGRKEAHALVERLGGTAAEEVTSKTSRLVVGAVAPKANTADEMLIAESERSKKVQKAEEVNAKSPGQIRILTEEEFCRLAGLASPEALKQQFHAVRDIRSMYPAIREDHLRYLEKWGLIESAARTNNEKYYSFPDLLVIKQASAELEQGAPFRAVLRTLVAARAGQLTFDFRPVAGDAQPAKVIALERQAPEPDRPAPARATGSTPDVLLAAECFLEGSMLDDGEESKQGRAAAAYRKALAYNPDLVPALVNLANIHYARDELAEAQALYERASALEPDCFEARFNLGNIHHDAGRYDEAQRCYGQALALNPGYADAHFYLAVTLEKMGLSQDARPHWRAYQRLAPDGEWVELAREFSE